MSKYGKYGVCEWDDYDYSVFENPPKYTDEERKKLRRLAIDSINRLRTDHNLPLLTEEEKERIMNM